jgi:hypothetical protein
MHLQGLTKHDNFGRKTMMGLNLRESDGNKRKSYGCMDYRQAAINRQQRTVIA